MSGRHCPRGEIYIKPYKAVQRVGYRGFAFGGEGRLGGGEMPGGLLYFTAVNSRPGPPDPLSMGDGVVTVCQHGTHTSDKNMTHVGPPTGCGLIYNLRPNARFVQGTYGKSCADGRASTRHLHGPTARACSLNLKPSAWWVARPTYWCSWYTFRARLSSSG